MSNIKQIIKKSRHRVLGIALWGLFLLSVFLMFKSSADPLLTFLRGTIFESIFSQFSTGNQIIFDISVGMIVGLFIYVLIVWIPERSKRSRIRKNMAQQYDSFKEDCIVIFFSALQQSYNLDLLDRLKDR